MVIPKVIWSHGCITAELVVGMPERPPAELVVSVNVVVVVVVTT
jgi:hypothetical protein